MVKEKKKEYIWATQVVSPKVKRVLCEPYDPYADFRRDPTGYYVLIRVNLEFLTIEAAICNKEHVIEATFSGTKAQDVYEGIFAYERRYHLTWFVDKGHCAYLGKELKKAEIALALGQNNYYQE